MTFLVKIIKLLLFVPILSLDFVLMCITTVLALPYIIIRKVKEYLYD